MTSYKIDADSVQILIGWDDQLQTYFCQMVEGSELRLLIGYRSLAITTVGQLQDELRGHFELPIELVDRLRADRLKSQPPTQWHEFMRRFLDGP